MMKVEIVDEREVDKAKILFCYDEPDRNHTWGKLSLDWDHFYIGWRSRLMPEMETFGADSLAVGIDENYVVFTKQIPFTGTSHSPLLSIHKLDDIIALRFETEVHIFKAGMPAMWCEFGLRDISEELELRPTSMTVKCMGQLDDFTFDFPVLQQ
jgi:hypothetical protein